jgi:transposase
MTDINLLAIDVAKNVFQLHGINKRGSCVLTKRLNRNKLMEFISNLHICTIVMEACGGSFYWTRQFQKMGHEVKLISPQYVKPYVKGNKTDRNDAEAIAEAASRPNMRFVSIKSIEQQDIQSIHRIRSRVIQQRTQLGNQIRGLLVEYGIIIKKGISALRRALPEIIENGENELSIVMRRHIQTLYEELCHIDTRVEGYDKELAHLFKQSDMAQKIGKIEGIGPINATAILALGDLKNFKNGRHFAAFLGLVPRESSSGNKQRLLGISKRGDSYLRTLLIHGARSVLRRVDKKQDAKSQWLKNLKARCGMNRAACALANKTARIIWAVMTSGENYDPKKACGFCG